MKRTWRRRYLYHAQFESRCPICDEQIEVKDPIAYKPGVPAQHWACYMEGKEEPRDSGPDGSRKYASKWFTGSGKRGLSWQAAKDLETIARVKERRHSTLNGGTETV